MVKEEELKKELKDVIGELSFNSKERAISRSRYVPFSKYCLWLLLKASDGEDIFYPKDLEKFAKITYNTAYRFFKEMTNYSYMKETASGNLIFFELIKNDGHIKLKELLPYFKKTLTRQK